jgi:hypothetical protein
VQAGTIVNYYAAPGERGDRLRENCDFPLTDFDLLAGTLAEARLHVPFYRDRYFVERVALTEQIGDRLSTPSGRAALVGLGGVGYEAAELTAVA